jgi:hypothetical protein
MAHAKVEERLVRATRAAAFYERGVGRLENQWMGKGEPGERFRDAAHIYSEDLDIFGRGSLFELLCTARTRAGENTLAQWLLAPATREEAAARQQAVEELRSLLNLREDLAVLGDAVRSNMDPDAVAAWAEAPPVAFPWGARFLAPLLAAAVVLTFGLYMGRLATRTPLLAALFVELSYAFFLGSRTLRVSAAVNSPSRDLELFAKLLQRLERENFQAALLRRVRARLEESGLVASFQVGRLRALVNRLDWQRNIFFTPIAMATLWGAQIAMAIERWRKSTWGHLREWIDAAGEFEPLFALAGYSYEHPGDPFPELMGEGGGELEAAAGGVRLEAAAGGVRLEAAAGGVRLEAAAGGGRLEGAAGGGRLEGAAGGVRLEGAAGGGRLEAAAGGVRLDAARGGELDAEALGHPLLDEAQCVRNSVRLGGELRLLIVSGSNMSGKSTLLRAVGLNVVLAWAGAPVRATRLSISPLRLGASIRLLDSLQDGRSRFYTEITRLREIVGLAGGPVPVLFLMDELLSGTNSHDRRIGASAIVRTLVDRGAMGMITTHDLALAHISDDLPGRASNVHFADTLENGRLHFDYRLQPGVVERSNALDLMRSVGLDV